MLPKKQQFLYKMNFLFQGKGFVFRTKSSPRFLDDNLNFFYDPNL